MINKELLRKKNEEIIKIERTLIQMEQQLQEKYCEMGKNLLDLADSEQRTINRLVDQIIISRKQLANAKYQWRCGRCMTVNDAEVKQCGNCGETRNGETIQLLFTLDENYLKPLRVLLTSIFINNPQESFAVWIMHSAIPKDKLAELESFCDINGAAMYELPVDNSLFSDAPVMRHYTQEMYYRLLAPALLPEGLERVIYLDPDTLVINPLRPLWERDMEGMLFAAASHTGKTEFANAVNKVRLGTAHNYFNSGVLLIDLKSARGQIKPEEIFRCAREHKAELLLPDQDIFNSLYGQKTLEVADYIWNYDARNYLNYHIRSGGAADLDWVMENTVILHFCGSGKPWQRQYRQRFGILYKHYMRLAERQV